MKFLNKFFKKEEREGEVVEIDEVSKWVVENSSLNETYGRVMKLFLEIESLKKDILDKLKVLGETRINVREGEDRLKSLIEGNRENYIRVMEGFVSRIETPKNINSALSFCQDLEGGINSLSKKTSRNFYVMQNLIGNELVSVTRDVKRLDVLVKEIKRLLEDGKLKKLEKINKRIEEFKSSRDVNENFEKLKAEKRELLEKEEGVNWQIQELREKDDYQILNSLRLKLKKVKKDALEVEVEIKNLFYVLERPLKKFERMYENDLLGVYVKDFVQGLVNDEGLGILSILAELNSKIGRLALKDPDKVQRAIAEIRREKLIALRSGYLDLRKREKELEGKIKDDDTEDKIRRKENDLVLIERGILDVNRRIKAVSPVDKNELISSLEKDVLELTDTEVVIKDAVG